MGKINLKTVEEIQIMREGGKILEEVLNIALEAIRPGITLAHLDHIAEQEILKRGAYPSFKKVPGYTWTICACVNEVVVHGIPDEYVVEEGDVVGIDCGVYHKGFHTDAAWTIRVQSPQKKGKDEIDTFLAVGEKALYLGIEKVKAGNHIYDISKAVEDTVTGAGYSVVHTLVGHGVGRELHEEPEVPNFVRKKRGETPKIVPGLVIAVEVICNMGNREVVYRGDDGWTIITKDGKISALFEATVAVSPHGSLVLTKKYGASRNS